MTKACDKFTEDILKLIDVLYKDANKALHMRDAIAEDGRYPDRVAYWDNEKSRCEREAGALNQALMLGEEHAHGSVCVAALLKRYKDVLR